MKSIAKAITSSGLVAISVAGLYFKVEPMWVLGFIGGIGAMLALSLSEDANERT